MWLCLYNMVPFEYFSYLHRSAFVCQDYLLLFTVFILLFLNWLPHQLSCWHKIQDIVNKLSTLLDWRSSGVELYYTLSSLRSKKTWLEPSHSSFVFCPNLLQDILVYNSFLMNSSVTLRNSILVIQSHFIPSLVYSIDKKPAFHHHSKEQSCTISKNRL